MRKSARQVEFNHDRHLTSSIATCRSSNQTQDPGAASMVIADNHFHHSARGRCGHMIYLHITLATENKANHTVNSVLPGAPVPGG